ncbi:MAG: 50S ribosomal protein L4 [Patescibacteria group bacterium]
MKAPIYSQDGSKTGEIELPASLFEAKINPVLVHTALVRQHANARISPAHTLKRSEVAHSTIKILRQKGSGNARRGDRVSPIMRGGGVAWGPRNDRNFSRAMPKKARRLALASMLTSKAQESKIIALESFELKAPKTKEFMKLLAKLPASRSTLVVHNRNATLIKSAQNLEFVKPLFVNLLNPHDLTKFDQILFEKSALLELTNIFKIEAKVEKPAAKSSSKSKSKKEETAGVV